MSGQASDRKVGVISRELKRDVYENEKDLAFAKSSSCLAYYFRRSALRIFPLTPRIIGFAREHRTFTLTSHGHSTINSLLFHSVTNQV